MPQPLRAALYARVSTTGQATENQLLELRTVADRSGWMIAAEFVDEGMSGANGRDKRPALDRMLKAVTRREVDIVAAWSVDRLGRSLKDLVTLLSEMHGIGVNLYLHQQGVDTTTPAGKALFQMMGVFAEFERAMIVERVNAGLARARAQGRVLGRPRVGRAKEDAVRALLAAGESIHGAARKARVGTSVAQRIRREMQAGA